MTVNRCRFVAPLLIAAVYALPIGAGAQAPSYATRGETIRGTIASVQSLNHIFVDDDRGYTDDVTLRAGAAVFSNGVRLVPGERVTIEGSAAGPTFLAARIATTRSSYAAPADQAYAVPVPDYYPVPAYYPAPVYYPAPYLYSVGFGFGFGGYGGYGRYGRYGYRPFYGGYHAHGGVGIGIRGRIR